MAVVKEYISNSEQLERWVNGESIHRLIESGGDECCPDFSCCHSELLAEPDVRRAFAAANDQERMRFLGNFLGAAISTLMSDKKVHIAGNNPFDES